MKSKQFRTLEEIDGIKYRFDHAAFSDAIRDCSMRKKCRDKTYNQSRLMNELSELVCVSLDAIKNWKQGYNGPNSIDMVKTMADMLEVDYNDLLSPDTKEVCVEDEVLSIYQECLSTVYAFAEKVCNGSKRYDTYKEEILEKLDKISDQIDMYALKLNADTCNRLQRIVLEISSIILSHDTPERWVDVGIATKKESCFWFMDLDYMTFSSKVEALEGIRQWGNPSTYISDEIDMAIDLGLEDIKEFDDYEEFNKLSVHEQMEYGYIGEREISPLMLFKHMFRQSLCFVFQNDFGYRIR